MPREVLTYSCAISPVITCRRKFLTGWCPVLFCCVGAASRSHACSALSSQCCPQVSVPPAHLRAAQPAETLPFNNCYEGAASLSHACPASSCQRSSNVRTPPAQPRVAIEGTQQWKTLLFIFDPCAHWRKLHRRILHTPQSIRALLGDPWSRSVDS